MADGGLRGWSAEVEAYVWTMVNELLITSPQSPPTREQVQKDAEPELLRAQSGQPRVLLSKDPWHALSGPNIGKLGHEVQEPALEGGIKADGCSELSSSERHDSFTLSKGRKDVFEQIQKIRKVLSIDQAKELLDGSEETLEVPMADPQSAMETNGRLVQMGQEEFDQTLLTELSAKSGHQLKQKSLCGEIEDKGVSFADWQQSPEWSKVAQEKAQSELNKGTVAELEIDRLACQVHFLVHQLTICRQNLLKAEREVNMLHEENQEFRSLIQDILVAFSGS